MVTKKNLLFWILVVYSMMSLFQIQVQADTNGITRKIDLGIEPQKEKDFDREKLKLALEERIFQNPGNKNISVEKYDLSKQEWKSIIHSILRESQAEMFVTVLYEETTMGTVTALNVTVDDDFAVAVNELDEINEEQDEPLEQDELMEVKAHYAELQAFYEGNPDYFGIPTPYFTDKNTEASPMGAIIDIAGLDSENLDIKTLDELIIGMTQGLKSYVQYYGDALLDARDKALSCLDNNMSDVEKCLVLHDYISTQATMDLNYSNDFIEGTSFGALVTRKCVCLGYSSAYTYLIQCAFPEIYKNEDGSWKTKDDVKETYIVDYSKTIDKDSSHYFNVVKLDSHWYYVDVCFDDIISLQKQQVRLETDGNCHHFFFLNSYVTFARNVGTHDKLDSAYKYQADSDKYETAWFSNVNSPIYYNDDYWFYMEGQINWKDHKNIEDYIDKGDQLKARNRKTGEITVLVDFRSGNVQSLTEGDQGIQKELAAEYKNDMFYQKIYPGMQHSVALYHDVLYFNMSNKIYQYHLDTGEVSLLKEYNTVYAAKDSSANFTGSSFYSVDKDYGEIEFEVDNHPISGICIKDDGKMYVSIATNYNNASNPTYSVEAVNYIPSYSVYGEKRSNGDDFHWCANIKETLDMAHITGNSHNYQKITVESSCQEQGFDEWRCIDCGISSEQNRTNFTEKINHHYVYDSKEKVYVCSHCKQVSQNVKEHNYGEPEFQWSTDEKGQRCQAIFTCSVCQKQQVVEMPVVSVITKESTCTNKGELLYTASCSFQSKEYIDKKTDIMEAKGHSYGEPRFEWSEDYSLCNAYFNCNTCAETSAEKTVTCRITSQMNSADYTKEGTAVYTAFCTMNGKEYKDIQTVTIPALTIQTAFENSSYSLYVTQKKQLSIISNYSEEAIISMESSKPKLLKVSNDGTIEAVGAGRVIVTAQTKGGKTIQATVIIRTPKIVLSAKEVPLQEKKTTTKITVKSKIATDAIKRWSSSNKKVAIVSQKGKITAKKTGTTLITVRMKSGAQASCKIKVQKAPVQIKKLSLNKSNITLKLSGSTRSFQIVTAKTPVTATGKIIYQSANKKIVSVNKDGKITARKVGTTTVTVKCGKKTRKIKVKVKRK